LSFESSVAVVTGIDQWAELVTVGSDPRVALTSPDGAYALVSNYGSKTTSLVDLRALRTVATLPYHGAIGFHPDGQRFYIANDSTSTSDAVLYQYSLPGGQLAKSATLGRYSMNLTMRFSADGKTGYTGENGGVAFDCDTLAAKGLADGYLIPNRNASSQTVSYSVIDPDSGTLLALIPLRVYDESYPQVVVVSSDKTRVYTLISDNEVRVFRSLAGGDPVNLDADRVFAWAEQHASYGSLFTQPWQPSQTASGYYYRHYPSSGSYLGVAGGKLYYLGPASSNALLDLGALSDWLRQAGY
jgi:DNA-binding beta-propeller fold protein YncE